MEKRVVIITGASSGIGRETARVFASKNFNIVIAARRLDELEKLRSELESEYDTEILAVKTDVTRQEECGELIEATIDQFRQIDILINNAGISMRAMFMDLDLDVLKRVMDVNFWGLVYCTKYALPHILKTKGSVVGVSSIAGYRGLPGRTGYSASKFAMHGFLESLRTEHIYDGLHVLLFCPGYTASNIRKTALLEKGEPQGVSPREEKKMMSAEKVAKILFSAVEKRKKIVTLTTTGKMTVFLNKWLPSMMDSLVFNEIAKETGSPFKKVKS